MPKAVILCVDNSNAVKVALDWVLENLITAGDVLHLVHCFTPLKPSVGPHYAYVPSGRGWMGICFNKSLCRPMPPLTNFPLPHINLEKEQEDWRRSQSVVLEEFLEILKQVGEVG